MRRRWCALVRRTDGARPSTDHLPPVTSELVASELRRAAAPTPAADVFSACLDALDGHGEVRSTWSAGRAWNAVNGDIERAHTTGVFVREPHGHEQLPTLIVYVDSRSRVTDFTANREVYRARLENVGLRFQDVTFRVSKRPTRAAAAAPRKADGVAGGPSRPLPELTPEEAAEVERLCACLPDALRDSVSQAMRLSYRRERDEQSGIGE